MAIACTFGNTAGWEGHVILLSRIEMSHTVHL